MSIHKDNATGKWRVVYRYIDWTGKLRHVQNRETHTMSSDKSVLLSHLLQRLPVPVLHVTVMSQIYIPYFLPLFL